MKYMPKDLNVGSELFFDTSVIIYAYDKTEPEKHEIAKELVKQVFNGELTGFISNQILAELFYVLTEKKGVSKEDVETIVLSFLESDAWVKLNYTTLTVKTSVLLSKKIDVIFWDILISETMKENGIFKIITEDEVDFKKIPGIEVVNPFKQKL